MTSWLLQRVSAVILLGMLFWHLAAAHFPPRDIDFDNVVTRLADPAWKLFYAVFLALALFHALNGVWQVAGDWTVVQSHRRSIMALLWVTGAVFLALGLQVIVVFDSVVAVARP